MAVHRRPAREGRGVIESESAEVGTRGARDRDGAVRGGRAARALARRARRPRRSGSTTRAGSALYELICDQPEYYPPRLETALLEEHGEEIADAIGPDALVFEYGAGNARKTALLLAALRRPAAYVPVDISPRARSSPRREALGAPLPAARGPAGARPTSPRRSTLPARRSPCSRRLAFFPGSTIGNFDPPEAVALLRRMARDAGPGRRARSSASTSPRTRGRSSAPTTTRAGVTAAFDLNLLARMNRELGGDFRLWPASATARSGTRGCRGWRCTSRAGRPQLVHVAGAPFAFRDGRDDPHGERLQVGAAGLRRARGHRRLAARPDLDRRAGLVLGPALRAGRVKVRGARRQATVADGCAVAAGRSPGTTGRSAGSCGGRSSSTVTPRPMPPCSSHSCSPVEHLAAERVRRRRRRCCQSAAKSAAHLAPRGQAEVVGEPRRSAPPRDARPPAAPRARVTLAAMANSSFAMSTRRNRNACFRSAARPEDHHRVEDLAGELAATTARRSAGAAPASRTSPYRGREEAAQPEPEIPARVERPDLRERRELLARGDLRGR